MNARVALLQIASQQLKYGPNGGGRMPRNHRPDQIGMGGRILSVQVAGSPRNTHQVCDNVHVIHKPRLLSENGFTYVSGELAEWLVAGSRYEALAWRTVPPPNHSKIELWQNRIPFESYFLPKNLTTDKQALVVVRDWQDKPVDASGKELEGRADRSALIGKSCRTIIAI